MTDTSNGYTYDSKVYTGKGTPVSKLVWLMMLLCKYLKGKRYHTYFVIFYTSVQLVKDWLVKKILS